MPPWGRLIRLQRGLAPAQRVKTLAHELAHSDLHQDGYLGTPRPLAELEAESVAYVVCQAVGIDRRTDPAERPAAKRSPSNDRSTGGVIWSTVVISWSRTNCRARAPQR